MKKHEKFYNEYMSLVWERLCLRDDRDKLLLQATEIGIKIDRINDKLKELEKKMRDV